MTIFGNLTSRADLEAAVKSVIINWIDTYLAEVERQRGLTVPFYSRPRSITTTNHFAKWDEDQLPAIVIISNGFSAPPKKKGDGTYNTWWGLGVAVVVSAVDEQETRDMASDYTLALLAIFAQRQSLNGFANGIEIADVNFDDIDDGDRRSLASGQIIMSVEVDDVVQANVGPSVPTPPVWTPDDPPVNPEAPFPDWPIATSGSVEIDIVKELP